MKKLATLIVLFVFVLSGTQSVIAQKKQGKKQGTEKKKTQEEVLIDLKQELVKAIKGDKMIKHYYEKYTEAKGKRDTIQAINNLKNILISDPKLIIVYELLADIKFSKKDYESAIVNYTKVLNDKSGRNIYNKRGLAYHKNEKYNDAIKDFEKAIEMGDKNEFINTNLGISYCAIKKYEQAIVKFNRVIHDYVDGKKYKYDVLKEYLKAFRYSFNTSYLYFLPST